MGGERTLCLSRKADLPGVTLIGPFEGPLFGNPANAGRASMVWEKAD
jgi:hypothetical protein